MQDLFIIPRQRNGAQPSRKKETAGKEAQADLNLIPLFLRGKHSEAWRYIKWGVMKKHPFVTHFNASQCKCMNWNVWYQAEWLISWVQARLEAAWHELVRFQALKYIQHLCTSSYRSESGSFDPLTEIKEQTRNFFGSAFSTYRIMTETSCASRTTCNFVLLPCFSFKKNVM